MGAAILNFLPSDVIEISIVRAHNSNMKDLSSGFSTDLKFHLSHRLLSMRSMKYYIDETTPSLMALNDTTMW